MSLYSRHIALSLKVFLYNLNRSCVVIALENYQSCVQRAIAQATALGQVCLI